ncbi:MAG: hypothetical protein ABSC55_25595 [Syntrophorhabdales bacterium]|jgi:hypothetical protein
METINRYSAEWRDFVKNEKKIYRALDWGTTAFANLQPLPELTMVLGRRYYRHELLCTDGLARYFCNNAECASWDGETLTMAWDAFSYHRLDEALQKIHHKCSTFAYERAREAGLAWPSAEQNDYNRLEVETREFCILPRGSWPGIGYRGPVAYNLMRHEFPPDHPHTLKLMDWLVRKCITTRHDGGKYFACIQGLGLPVPDELKGAFDDKVWVLESDSATSCQTGAPDQDLLSGQTMISP